MIDKHHHESIRSLLKLMKGTPRSVLYFLAGSLPGSALLHLRQLTLFGMISRMKDSILYSHALNVFSSATIFRNSWFHQIKNLCELYDLPHPLQFLQYPCERFPFKKLIKSKVVSHWEILLREEATSLRSLTYFNPSYMSLVKPHPLWSTAGSSSVQVAKACVQATMLSGRYRCGSLMRHWNVSSDGHCLLSNECVSKLEDIQHILIICPALNHTRLSLRQFTTNYCSNLPDHVSGLITEMCSPEHPLYCQFLLDPSSIPSVISASQCKDYDALAQFLYVGRTWVYALHRERLKLLGIWKRSCASVAQ